MSNSMPNSVFNRRWAEVILESLTRHGMRHICIAGFSFNATHLGSRAEP